MNRIFLGLFFIFLTVLFLSSCEKPEAFRTYSEVVVDSSKDTSATNAITDPHAGLNMDFSGSMPGMDNNTDPHAGFTKEQLAQMLAQSGVKNVSQSPMSWTLPETWQEKPATGMRIASFVSKNDASAFDCSIVALGAGAGGLEPNIIRWLGQLNLTQPPEKELKDFIESQEKVNLDENFVALLVDFTSLQRKSDDKTPSMLAAIIETTDQRIFVKMTGSKETIIQQSQVFKTFVKSLKFRK